MSGAGGLKSGLGLGLQVWEGRRRRRSDRPWGWESATRGVESVWCPCPESCRFGVVFPVGVAPSRWLLVAAGREALLSSPHSLVPPTPYSPSPSSEAPSLFLRKAVADSYVNAYGLSTDGRAGQSKIILASSSRCLLLLLPGFKPRGCHFSCSAFACLGGARASCARKGTGNVFVIKTIHMC